jgi:hypothetical protein
MKVYLYSYRKNRPGDESAKASKVCPVFVRDAYQSIFTRFSHGNDGYRPIEVNF